MSWISKNEKLSNIVVPALLSLVLLFVIEAIFAIVHYHSTKPLNWSALSSVNTLNRMLNPDDGVSYQIEASVDVPEDRSGDKLHTIQDLRDSGERAFPSYIFEPQLHHPGFFYHLANVPASKIVYCDENGPFNSWVSDELGFRNPSGQLGSQLDVLIIGDSFAEGACENEQGTIAGFLRESDLSVGNLARGGSGPLFQLATLVEYGPAFQSDELLWIVFTGNDLPNLREEKTTMLARYLEPGFSQGLLERRQEVGDQLKSALDQEIEANLRRSELGIAYPINDGYGETLDLYEIELKERDLLLEVAGRIHDEARSQGMTLKIVVLNHINYDEAIERLTSAIIKGFAEENDVQYLEFTREFLTINSHMYTEANNHFDAMGYRQIGEFIVDWLSAEPAESLSY